MRIRNIIDFSYIGVLLGVALLVVSNRYESISTGAYIFLMLGIFSSIGASLLLKPGRKLLQSNWEYRALLIILLVAVLTIAGLFYWIEHGDWNSGTEY